MLSKMFTGVFLCVILSNYSVAQSNLCTFMKKNNYDILVTTEPFNYSLGYLAKVSQDVLNKKHLESTLGLAFQNSYTFRTKIEKSMSQDTRVTDHSFLLTNDWKYFPFSKKCLYVEVGIYGGFTSSISKGSLRLPEYDIEENYYNRHNYFNYGSIQSLGWRAKNHFELGVFSMISLNGILDSGRTRPAEIDSRFYIGLKFGFRFVR